MVTTYTFCPHVCCLMARGGCHSTRHHTFIPPSLTERGGGQKVTFPGSSSADFSLNSAAPLPAPGAWDASVWHGRPGQPPPAEAGTCMMAPNKTGIHPGGKWKGRLWGQLPVCLPQREVARPVGAVTVACEGLWLGWGQWPCSGREGSGGCGPLLLTGVGWASGRRTDELPVTHKPDA